MSPGFDAMRRTIREDEQGRRRQAAEEARQADEVQAQAARRRACAADMNLVQQGLMANKLGRAQELLNRHRPAGKSEVRSPEVRNAAQRSTSNAQPLTNLRGWEWRYRWQQGRSDAHFTLCQFSNEISALSVSPDGKWVAVGEYGDRGVSIWDLRARAEVTRFPPGESSDLLAFSPVTPLRAFWPDREKLVSASGDQPIHLWDRATAQECCTSGVPRHSRRLRERRPGGGDRALSSKPQRFARRSTERRKGKKAGHTCGAVPGDRPRWMQAEASRGT